MTGATVLEAVVNGVWQGVVVALLTTVALRVARAHMTAAARYIVCWAALLCIALLPFVGMVAKRQPVVVMSAPTVPTVVATAPAPVATASQVAPSVQQEDGAPPAAEALTTESRSRAVQVPAALPDIVLGVWACIAALLISAVARSYLRIRRLRLGMRLLPLSVRAAAAVVREASGVRRAVRIGVSDDVAVPVTLGFLDPIVLIPATHAEALDTTSLTQVIAHELAHVARRDDWARLAQRLVGALFFLQPAVHFMARRLDLERELACDDLVMHSTGSSRESYARCLLRVGELAVGSRRVPAGALSMASHLRRRIELLLDARPRDSQKAFAIVAPLPALIVLGLAAIPGLRLDTLPGGPDIMPVKAEDGTVAARADALFRRFEAYGYHGAVLIAHRGDVVLRKGYGLADRERGTPFTASTAFNGGAVAKMLTAAAILKLEEQGRLQTSDPVADYLGEFPAPKSAVTIHHLLTHTAGLTQPWAPVQRADRDGFVRAMKATPADYPAGTGHRYTDHGHALLAAVIEVASGMSYEDYVHSALLEPAGLTDTRFESEAPTSAPLAVEYADFAGSGSRVGTRPYVWGRRGAMGVISTVEDLWRWHKALEDGRILGEDARTRMLTGWTATGRPTRIGYGWEVGTSRRGTRIRHRLSAWGTSSVEVVYDEDEDLFIAFAANAPTNWAQPKYIEVINAALGLEHLDPPAPLPIKRESLLAFEGRYQPPSGGHIDVAADDNGALLLHTVGEEATLAVTGQDLPQTTVLARALSARNFAVLQWTRHRMAPVRFDGDTLLVNGKAVATRIAK
jgi:CubicO group peptidase (beta-lactamase class C family)